METIANEVGGYLKLAEMTGISVNTLRNYSRIGYKVEHINASLLHRIATVTGRSMDQAYALILNERRKEK